MNTEMKYNALNAIAKRCSDAMNAISKDNLAALREITDRFAVDAKLIGFSKIEMMHEIGVVNGVLKNRKLN